MNGYTPEDKRVKTSTAISGIVAGQEVAKFGTTAGGAKNLRVDLQVSGVTVVGSITAKLQMATTDADTYADLAGANASVAITADGYFSLRQNIEVAADQPNMPLKKMVRVVIVTTNAGDEVTVDHAYVLQEL
jgi:hypothetical protein